MFDVFDCEVLFFYYVFVVVIDVLWLSLLKVWLWVCFDVDLLWVLLLVLWSEY